MLYNSHSPITLSKLPKERLSDTHITKNNKIPTHYWIPFECSVQSEKGASYYDLLIVGCLSNVLQSLRRGHHSMIRISTYICFFRVQHSREVTPVPKSTIFKLFKNSKMLNTKFINHLIIKHSLELQLSQSILRALNTRKKYFKIITQNELIIYIII